MAAAVVVSRVSPASVSTSSGKMAKTSRLPTERMLTPCSGRDDTVPGWPSLTMRSRRSLAAWARSAGVRDRTAARKTVI